jgi:hypothetical protein
VTASCRKEGDAWPVALDEAACLPGRLVADERERFLDAVMVRLGKRPLLDCVR